MAHGLIIESKISADNVEALNRSVVSTTADFDGGNLMVLTAPTTVGEDRWTATVPATGAVSGLWVAYNPTDRFIDVEGRVFAGLLADERAYTNLKGKTFDAFKPKVGDEIDFTVDCIDDATDAVAGDYLEAKAGQATLTRVAEATGATASTTAFQIEYVKYAEFAKADIGFDKVAVYHTVCVAE